MYDYQDADAACAGAHIKWRLALSLERLFMQPIVDEGSQRRQADV